MRIELSRGVHGGTPDVPGGEDAWASLERIPQSPPGADRERYEKPGGEPENFRIVTLIERRA